MTPRSTDLLVTQCLFVGDEVSTPQHLSILVNGSQAGGRSLPVLWRQADCGVLDSREHWSRDAQLPRAELVRVRGLDVRRREPTSIFGTTSSPMATTCGSVRALVPRMRRLAAFVDAVAHQEQRPGAAVRVRLHLALLALHCRGRWSPWRRPRRTGRARRRSRGRRSAQPLQSRNSLFAGNKKFTGTGGGPALNFRDNDPSFLE